MASKTIKISEENYKKLLEIATEIQKINGVRASFDDAIKELAKEKRKKKKISDLTGAWKMSDSEWEKIKDELNRGWKTWKMQSV
ncbi:MAG: antitoxin VapB family protein [Nanoarchaeota archaeon]